MGPVRMPHPPAILPPTVVQPSLLLLLLAGLATGLVLLFFPRLEVKDPARELAEDALGILPLRSSTGSE